MSTNAAPLATLDVSSPFEPGFPLVVSPRGTLDPTSWAREITEIVEEELEKKGAILFRGFSGRGIEDFQAFVRLVTPELLSYEFGSTPRSQLSGRVYTSTEYPAHQSIPQHNEQSYTTEWPLRIWFFCEVASPEGGATPLADSRRVFDALPRRIKERFEEKKVMYVRNYGNGLDVPWEKVFGTEDRREVERFCRQLGVECEWKEDGELRTRQVCQAVARHPRTGERVWFNQAHLFHVSNLEPSVREGLLAAIDEDELPRNAYYGDGGAIEDSVLDEVRAVYSEHTWEFAWAPGDVLLLDNMLVSHGRAPYRGPRKILVAMAQPYSELGAREVSR